MGPMHLLGILALASAAAIGGRWYLRRFDSLGRPRAFPWISVVGLVVIGVAAIVPWFLRMRLEARLAAAASTFVGEDVEVNCQSFGEAFVDPRAEFGYVAFGPDGVPEKETLIKRDQCRDLKAYLDSDKVAPSAAQIVAVHTLTHEAIHMTGVTSESKTECLAIHRDAEMAQLLGAPRGAAEDLAALYWEIHFPSLPPEYTSDCPSPNDAAPPSI